MTLKEKAKEKGLKIEIVNKYNKPEIHFIHNKKTVLACFVEEAEDGLNSLPNFKGAKFK
jgi:hypothetical protein